MRLEGPHNAREGGCSRRKTQGCRDRNVMLIEKQRKHVFMRGFCPLLVRFTHLSPSASCSNQGLSVFSIHPGNVLNDMTS